MNLIIIGIIAIVVFLIAVSVICAISWYRIVSPSEAHVVVWRNHKKVYSSDEKIASENTGATYFAVPEWIPFFGKQVRDMDLTIKEIVHQQETLEKEQGRYNVKSSTKYRINDVKKASETIFDLEELAKQLEEVIAASVRTATIKYDVKDARAKKQEMADVVKKEMINDLERYGLILESFQLVDFSDTKDSRIISDISEIREVSIQTNRREQNAEKEKEARMKEAESIELAETREIARDKVLEERKQEMAQAIEEKKKLAEEKRFKVIKVQTIEQANINKEKAEVLAKQEKEVALIGAQKNKEAEEINKAKKKLEGEGDKLKAEEIAKGAASPIREKGNAEAEIIKAKGLAEAEAKNKLQEALNKFDDKAVRALVAEKIVEMEKEVGIAAAKALEKSDMKVFAGSDNGKGFDIGKLIESTRVSSNSLAESLINRIAKPNDLGVSFPVNEVGKKKK
jgi:flotillin